MAVRQRWLRVEVIGAGGVCVCVCEDFLLFEDADADHWFPVPKPTGLYWAGTPDTPYVRHGP